MNKKLGEQGPKPQDPELLPSQLAVKTLCDDILAIQSPHVRPAFEDVGTRANPEEVQERLRNSSLGDLLLKDGDTLSAVPASDHRPDLGLFVGKAKLIATSLRAWGWDDDKRRIDPDGPDKPPYGIIDYPGEKDWTRQLDIKLWYSNGKHEACQTITVHTASTRAGSLPSMSRDVSTAAYAETGYEGHNQVVRADRDEEEVLAFITLAKELFDNRDDNS